MKKFLFLPLLLAIFSLQLSSLPVFAEEEAVKPSISTERTSAQQEAKRKLEEQIKISREAKKQEMEKARETFKEKAKTIKDEKKRTTVENIDKKMAELNATRVKAMAHNLDQIEETLKKIESRVAKLGEKGRDISSVKSAIETARSAIATARQKISDQAAKVYAIQITTESKLGTSVSATRTTFNADLKATHQSVVDARKSVRDILSTTAKLSGERLTSTVEK